MNAKHRLEQTLGRHGFKPSPSGEFARPPLSVVLEPSGRPGVAQCSDGKAVSVRKLDDATVWVDKESSKLDDFEQGY